MATEKGDTRRCQATRRALSAKKFGVTLLLRSFSAPEVLTYFPCLTYGGTLGQNTGAYLIGIFIRICIDAWFLSVNGEAGEKVCV